MPSDSYTGHAGDHPWRRRGEPEHVSPPPGTKSPRKGTFERAGDTAKALGGRARNAAKGAAYAAADAAEATGGFFHRSTQPLRAISDVLGHGADALRDHIENIPNHAEKAMHDIGRRADLTFRRNPDTRDPATKEKERTRLGKEITFLGAAGTLLAGVGALTTLRSDGRELAVVTGAVPKTAFEPHPQRAVLPEDIKAERMAVPENEIEPAKSVPKSNEIRTNTPLSIIEYNGAYTIQIPIGEFRNIFSATENSVPSNLYFDTDKKTLITPGDDDIPDPPPSNLVKLIALGKLNAKQVTIEFQSDPNPQNHPLLSDLLAGKRFIIASRDYRENVAAQFAFSSICDVYDNVVNTERMLDHGKDDPMEGVDFPEYTLKMALSNMTTWNLQSVRKALTAVNDINSTSYEKMPDAIDRISRSIDEQKLRLTEFVTLANGIRYSVTDTSVFDVEDQDSRINLNDIRSNPRGYLPLRMTLDASKRIIDYALAPAQPGANQENSYQR